MISGNRLHCGKQISSKFLVVTAIILVITIPLQIASPTNSLISDENNALDETGIEHIGINMRGYYTAQTQNRDPGKEVFPHDYYDQSFKILSNSGIDFVRYLFFWEAYEKNTSSFMQELKTVAKTADKWNISVVYASDNFATSSHLDPKSGYGFPSYLFDSTIFPKASGGGSRSHNIEAKLWWTKLWERSLKSINGTDAWTLQANFLKAIVSTVEKYNSTIGYEILNEPHVYSSDQWEKIGDFNTFIVNELRSMTNKLILYDRHVPSDLYGYLNISAQNIAKMAPSNKTNVIFKATLFASPADGSYYENKLHTYQQAANLADVPLCLCEFSVRGTGSVVKQSKIILSTEKLFEVIEKLQELGSWGLGIWIWDYKPRVYYNFNLITIINGTIIPTENTNNTISTISLMQSGSSNQTTDDTIYPVGNVTSVYVKNKTNSSSEPVTSISNSSSFTEKVRMKGEAFDVGSGIKSVYIRVGNGQYVLANQTNHGNWLNWEASYPVSHIQNDTYTIKLEDNAGNLEHVTGHWKPISQYGVVQVSEKVPKSALDYLIDSLRDFFS
jgi:Cellulase (glycosyl hydrolase family 5)